LRRNAVSAAGGVGIMQTLPQAAHETGCANGRDVRCEIHAGARDLARLPTRHLRLALAAYDAGPGAATRFGGVPPYAENRAYVTGIVDAARGRKSAARTTRPDKERSVGGVRERLGHASIRITPTRTRTCSPAWRGRRSR
jgi:soluble lytic murein transglycosylase-like protein